jgi:molybdenum cofactor guanylyltransferase
MATAAILAGDQSRRMGTDKALVLFQGKPLILHVIEWLPEVEQLFVISPQRDQYSTLCLPVYADPIPA